MTMYLAVFFCLSMLPGGVVITASETESQPAHLHHALSASRPQAWVTRCTLRYEHNNSIVAFCDARLPCSGTYQMLVEMLYPNFDPNNFINTPLLDFKARYDLKMSEPTQSCKELLDAHRGISGTPPPPAPAPTPTSPKALRSCSLRALEDSSKTGYWIDGTFRRTDCEVKERSELAAWFVNSNKSVCLIGDSQSRHLSYYLAQALEPEKYKWVDAAKGSITQLVDDRRVQFFINVWANESAVPMDQLQSCDYMLVGFGQWHSAWTTKYPWTTARYARGVKEYLTHLKKNNVTPDKMIWVSLHATNPLREMHLSPPSDWRSFPLQVAYDRAAREACRQLNIPFVDVFTPSSLRQETTYDLLHFIAPVEREISNLVLQGLQQL